MESSRVAVSRGGTTYVVPAKQPCNERGSTAPGSPVLEAGSTVVGSEVVTIEAMTSEPPGPTIPCRPQSVDVGAAPYYCIAAHAQAKDRRSSAGGFGPAMLRHRGRKSEDFRSVVLARHNEPWPHKQERLYSARSAGSKGQRGLTSVQWYRIRYLVFRAASPNVELRSRALRGRAHGDGTRCRARRRIVDLIGRDQVLAAGGWSRSAPVTGTEAVQKPGRAVSRGRERKKGGPWMPAMPAMPNPQAAAEGPHPPENLQRKLPQSIVRRTAEHGASLAGRKGAPSRRWRQAWCERGGLHDRDWGEASQHGAAGRTGANEDRRRGRQDGHCGSEPAPTIRAPETGVLAR
ncbi:hypothetical protein ACCO45_000639 [Purpureocillium lilacinum]|uniref:Uncharacterized protein n=1 Tax=Purpureocillium lilacinum TaxID=33203 RepID=A0ACC4E7J2_PURLI